MRKIIAEQRETIDGQKEQIKDLQRALRDYQVTDSKQVLLLLEQPSAGLQSLLAEHCAEELLALGPQPCTHAECLWGQ